MKTISTRLTQDLARESKTISTPFRRTPVQPNGTGPLPAPKHENGSYRRPLPRQTAPVLAQRESGAMRDTLIGELAEIASDELLTEWALPKAAGQKLSDGRRRPDWSRKHSRRGLKR